MRAQAVTIAMEAEMEAVENSGIKDKAKLKEYLYKNPTKLAVKLAQLLENNHGELLQPVRFKGSNSSYYYSINHKKHIVCPRNGEYYLLNWMDEDNERCYVYGHYTWQIGVILKVFKDQIEFLGFN